MNGAIGSLITGIASVIGPIIVFPMLDRLGRKTILFAGFVGVAVALIMAIFAFAPFVYKYDNMTVKKLDDGTYAGTVPA